MATRSAEDEDISPVEALSPVDGRYWAKVKPLAAFFSEGALFRYRVRVEVEYLLALVRSHSCFLTLFMSDISPYPSPSTFVWSSKPSIRILSRKYLLLEGQCESGEPHTRYSTLSLRSL